MRAHEGTCLKLLWIGRLLTGEMQGAVIGAILYEGWAKTVEEAEKLAALEINFSPCNDHNAVGPMAGIISPTMPVAIIENKTFGNKAFATFNEGLGRRLRFGAYDEGVMERLRWIKTVLAPALQQTIAANPIQLKTLLAQALQMGDECHNRNTAATSLLTRQLGPMLMNSVRDTAQVYSILEFLRDNDHFFLNLSMACSKSMLQASADIDGSSLVTIMSRNGVEFGIQMSGTGKQWFTAPSPVVDGLYFPGTCPNAVLARQTLTLSSRRTHQGRCEPGSRRQQHHRDSWIRRLCDGCFTRHCSLRRRYRAISRAAHTAHVQDHPRQEP